MNNTVDREILEIDIDYILPNRFQPRLSFDEKSLNELADSIREHGIIQPLVVRKLEDKYEIIAGERRYKAACLVRLKKVPVIVMNIDDKNSAEIAIVENIQRKEMTPLEEAKSYKKLLDKGYLTQEQLAVRMGKSQSSIANKLRLLNLNEDVQDALLHEKISERHARSLLKLKDKEQQKQMLNEILSKKLTVRQTDELIKKKHEVSEVKNEEINSNIETQNIFDNTVKPENYSEPNSVIPNPYENYEPNPQLNIINQLNESFPEENNLFLNKNEKIDIDIEKLKNAAQDINVQQSNVVDIERLLKPKEAPSAKNIDNFVETQEIKNKFIVFPEQNDNNFSDYKNEIDNDDIEILDFNISDNKQEVKLEHKNITDAVNLIKSNIENLNNSGFNINIEELDSEKTYQIIVKIDK